MRGVASIRTETHLRRFLHGIRLFCNAHSPPKALSPQNLFLSQKHAPIFQSTLLPLAIRALHRPISLRLIRAFVALFRCAQYGLLSPYFAALNTGFCRPISLRSIRALATLLPPLGGNALRRSGYVLAAPPLARIRLRNPPVLPLAIRAKVTQFIQSTSR